MKAHALRIEPGAEIFNTTTQREGSQSAKESSKCTSIVAADPQVIGSVQSTYAVTQ